MKRTLALLALIAGGFAAFAGSPYRASRVEYVSAAELAQWIRDRKPGLRVIDLRSPQEFDAGHVPTSEAAETIVIIGGGPRKVLQLKEGIGGWKKAPASRYFGLRRRGC